MHQRDNQVNTTLSLEEQNHLLLQETLRVVRQMRRIYLIQVSMTVAFVVLPIIGTAIFLPRIIQSASEAFQSFTSSQSGSSLINQEQLNEELFNRVQNLQNQ